MVDTFLDNAQRIFDVARADDSNTFDEFAIVVRPDGGLHFIMGTPVSVEGASAYAGAQSTYRVTRSPNGVRVEGKTFGSDGFLQHCSVERRDVRAELFRDRPLYLTASPAS
ncbi:MAG TPA: hypothetical protein VG273_04405 [Bryobacteraceae bacterium]|nr:hypothetical protein [Bryobacteraceae bacterium]